MIAKGYKKSEIQKCGIRNPEGWNLESRGLESGIQWVRIRNPDGRNPESRTFVDSVTWVDTIVRNWLV